VLDNFNKSRKTIFGFCYFKKLRFSFSSHFSTFVKNNQTQTQTMNTITLRPGKTKALLLALLSLAFLAIGLQMVEKQVLIGQVLVVFFGIGTVVSLVPLIPSAFYLKLTQEGFEVCKLFKKSFTRWDEVGSFTVSYTSTSKFVVFNYTDKSRKRARTSQALAGYDAALPDSFGMKVEELADLMNKWKKKVLNK